MIYIPMRDSSIIKALEWCSELRLCVDCPMRAEGYFSHSGNACRQALMKNALNLIIRQSADIEALKDNNEHLAVMLSEAKQDVAREIFEQIGECANEFAAGYLDDNHFLQAIYDLRAKYTEEKT